MRSRLFDSTAIREAQEAMDFMGNVLEASTEYGIIGENLGGEILLWNEGARRMYGYEPEEVEPAKGIDEYRRDAISKLDAFRQSHAFSEVNLTKTTQHKVN